MNKQQEARTVPAMPAAKKRHKPTLIFRMPVEDREEEKKKAGRYSIIPPREK